MDPLAADLTLAETAAHLRRTRTLAQRSMAVPIRLLGGAWLVLSLAALAAGRNHLAPFVGLALLAVTFLAQHRYRRIAEERGIRASLWPWLAVALLALVGGAAASRGGAQHHLAWLNIAGPFLVNALALAAVALALRSITLARGAVGIALIAGLVALTLYGDPAVAVELALGGILLLLTARALAG